MVQHPAGTPGQDLENGIFNLVIQLTQHLSVQHGAEVSREYVATYLDSLANGLRTIPNDMNERDKE